MTDIIISGLMLSFAYLVRIHSYKVILRES
jgi:hypothetical protein